MPFFFFCAILKKNSQVDFNRSVFKKRKTPIIHVMFRSAPFLRFTK